MDVQAETLTHLWLFLRNSLRSFDCSVITPICDRLLIWFAVCVNESMRADYSASFKTAPGYIKYCLELDAKISRVNKRVTLFLANVFLELSYAPIFPTRLFYMIFIRPLLFFFRPITRWFIFFGAPFKVYNFMINALSVFLIRGLRMKWVLPWPMWWGVDPDKWLGPQNRSQQKWWYATSHVDVSDEARRMNFIHRKWVKKHERRRSPSDFPIRYDSFHIMRDNEEMKNEMYFEIGFKILEWYDTMRFNVSEW